MQKACRTARCQECFWGREATSSRLPQLGSQADPVTAFPADPGSFLPPTQRSEGTSCPARAPAVRKCQGRAPTNEALTAQPGDYHRKRLEEKVPVRVHGQRELPCSLTVPRSSQSKAAPTLRRKSPQTLNPISCDQQQARTGRWVPEPESLHAHPQAATSLPLHPLLPACLHLMTSWPQGLRASAETHTEKKLKKCSNNNYF